MRFSLALLTLAVGCYAQVPQDTTFQISYISNLNLDDSVVNVTNTGLQGPFGLGTAGNICANIYVFDPQEEEIGCCACLVTPNGLNSLSAKADLISNNLTPAVPTSIVIKIVGTRPELAPDGVSRTLCNPANLADGIGSPLDPLANGLVAWNTNTHVSATGGPFHTEVAFRPVILGVPIGSATITAGSAAITISNPAIAVGAVATGVGIPPGTFINSVNNVTGTITLTNNATISALVVITVTAGVVVFSLPAPTELTQLARLCNFIQANGTGYGICKSCRLGALGGAKQ